MTTTSKLLWINTILMIFLFLYSSEANDLHDQADSNQAHKSSVIGDEDDLIKTESQDVLQHKAYPPANQAQYENAPGPNNIPQAVYHQAVPYDSINLPMHVLNRPGYMLSNLPPPKAQANVQGPGHYGKQILPPQSAGSAVPAGSLGPPLGPIHGHHPAPVYNHAIPPAAHLHDNQVEYEPEPGSHGYQSGYENNHIQVYRPPQVPYPQPPQQPYPKPPPPDSEGNQLPLPAPNTPKITNLDVKCEKNLMKVAIQFEQPFFGTIFSKGYYYNSQCVYVYSNSGKTQVQFDIRIDSCGTSGSNQNGLYGYGSDAASGNFFENTIIVQYDSQVQEVWDQARKLRCSWHDQYEKSVSFRPFPVDVLDVVRADFAGDNVGCWMQIQVGKGPWASEIAGIVKIGQMMTMVLAIKDEENKFDMLVRNCVAHDGKRAPIELVDARGCIVRNKLMSSFTKIKNFGSSATVLSYAQFQAFKFPDSLEVHFQCMIQICRNQCPAQCADEQGTENGNGGNGADIDGSSQQYQENYASSNLHSVSKSREERDLSSRFNNLLNSEYSIDSTEIGLNKIIQVVSTGDLAFTVASNETIPILDALEGVKKDDLICMSTINFATSVIILIAILVISCLLSIFLCLQNQATEKTKLAELALPYEIRAYPSNQKVGSF